MQISDGSLHPFEYGIRFIIELTQDSSVNLIGVELSIWNGEHLLKVKPCSEVTGHMASVAYIENGYWKWIKADLLWLPLTFPIRKP